MRMRGLRAHGSLEELVFHGNLEMWAVPLQNLVWKRDRPQFALAHSLCVLRSAKSQRSAVVCRGAASMGFNWEKYEAWRKHPMLTNNLRLRHSLPGLGLATAAFGIFVAYDKLVAGNSGGHH